jgi:hypothetical protein
MPKPALYKIYWKGPDGIVQNTQVAFTWKAAKDFVDELVIGQGEIKPTDHTCTVEYWISQAKYSPKEAVEHKHYVWHINAKM